MNDFKQTIFKDLPAGRVIIEDGIELTEIELEAINSYIEAGKVLYKREWQLWDLLAHRAEFQLFGGDVLRVRKFRELFYETDDS